jgi:hypothetical protein
MYIIRPIEITDALFHSTNVPESDYPAWNISTAYSAGDRCIRTSTHMIYEALVSVTGGDPPETDVLAETPKWAEVSATNRWKPLDKVVGTKATRAESAIWVLKPGEIVDALAILNTSASQIQTVLGDLDANLITNGTAWTGATGTTQPTGWDKVGAPSDFTIDSGALRITSDAAGEGMSVTLTVSAETEYQLLGKYRNTSGDIAQYAVYDVSNGADITATTDLESSTVDSTMSNVFTTPAGCTSIRVSLLCKGSGDIVWFDDVTASEVIFNETTNMISTINVVDEYTYFFEPIIWATSVTKLNMARAGIPPYSNPSVTVNVLLPGGTAECGVIVVGMKLEIGLLQYGVQPGLESFSTIDETTYGTWSVTKRSNRKTLQGRLLVKNTIIDFIMNQMAEYESELLVWVGHEDYECVQLYGIYRRFQPTMSNYGLTHVDLEVRGVI